MSAYRNYVPWSKSNLSSTSYTSPKIPDTTTSKYGIKPKEDTSTEKPTSLRKSKNESLINVLTNKYANYNKDKVISPEKELAPKTSTSKYSTTKDETKSKYDTKPKYDLKTSTIPTSTSKYGKDKTGSTTTPASYPNRENKFGFKKDDGPPITYNTRGLGARSMKSRSRDPSPDISSKIIPRAATRSRDPSPSSETALQRITRNRSRDPSPLGYPSSRQRSRDPSPATDSYTNSSSTSYRPYASRIGYNPSTTTTPTLSSKALEDIVNKYRYGSSLPRSSDRLLSPEPRYRSRQSSVSEDNKIDSTRDQSKIGSKFDKYDLSPTITVVTRATSPTPPGASQFVRARRADMAKTIEKTIPRPSSAVSKADKAMQSDRLDDSTKYSRFAGSTRVASAPWSSYLDMKYSPGGGTSRYSSSGTRYSGYASAVPRDTTVTTSRSSNDVDVNKTNEPKRETTVSKTSDESEKKSMIPKNKSASSSSKSSSVSSQSSSGSSSSLAEDSKRRTPPKTVQTENKKTPDSPNRTQLPPPFPKTESSVKTSPSISLVNKWPNKDFRKSALNMSSDKLIEQRKNLKSHSGNDSEPNSNFGSEPSLVNANSTSKIVRSDSTLNKSKSSSASKIPNKSPSPSAKAIANNRRSRTKSSSSESSSDSDSETSSTSSSEDVATNQKIPPRSPNNLSKNASVSKLTNGETKNEEAKSFLVRALGPVAKIFNKVRHQDSGDRTSWLSNFENNDKKSLKPAESGDRSSWLDESTNSTETMKKCASNTSLNCLKPDKDDSSGSLSRQNSRGSGKIRYKLRHIDSGEKPWWMSSEENINAGDSTKEKTEDQEDTKKKTYKEMESVCEDSNAESEDELTKAQKLEELGDRASPEGVEDSTGGKLSPYDNVPLENTLTRRKRPQNLFISRHTNIDDVLGGPTQLLSPLMDRILGKADGEDDDGIFEEIDPGMVRIHDSTAQRPVIQRAKTRELNGYEYGNSLDDAALQVYKDGDYGAYLDLESSLAEQHEEVEGLHEGRKNSLVVRTQLSVRVHTIIDKLQSCEGRELRRALFSLKQTFQADKDLVHGFVQLGGLACLLRVGAGADQNYQNYILRALGQVMLYVDGMNGVMAHNPTIQWLYTLIASQYRLVVKTALKLLLVFVEYSEGNCRLLVQAVRLVDGKNHSLPWSHIMNLLRDFDNADTELLIYATSLLNKTLSGLSDQDSFYDETDFLERQGMEGIVQRYMSRPGTDLDLLRQLQVYEAVLRFEDGDDEGLRQLDDTIRKTLRDRPHNTNEHSERRKSRRHSTGTSPYSPSNGLNNGNGTTVHRKSGGVLNSTAEDEESSGSTHGGYTNGYGARESKSNGAGVTPGLRRRRERAERQRSFIREQELRGTPPKSFGTDDDESHRANGGNYSHDSDGMSNDSSTDERKLLLHLKRENTVKDLTQKLANQNMLSPVDDQNKTSLLENMTGLISKAKEGLAKSKSKGELARSPSQDQQVIKQEIKKTENELHWEQLVENLDRPLYLCDLDFTDLKSDEEDTSSAPQNGHSGPPPPPPIQGSTQGGKGGPPPPPGNVPNPPLFGVTLQRHRSESESPPKVIPAIKKNKKTVKLFWKEVGNAPTPTVSKTIWDEMTSVKVDTHKLEHLFESRAKDLISKKQQEMNKNKEVIVLDHKRSNAINIAMTKLPPPRAIKAAILKMDSTVVTREGIEKLLNMIPSEEERGKIQEAQMANPELPLGSAEQFLLTLSSISELAARLKLWAFKLDFENSEREIAEPLMDLKQGMELLKANKTFRAVLSTLLSIGIFLNGAPVKGFQVEYLSKVPEVKDTVHKHSLLHHLCHMVMENFPEATDLYSEIGPITRASKVDFQELAQGITHLESECKASWDRLRALAKHEEQQNAAQQQKGKIQDFLQDAAQRIILLGMVNRRVMNRYRKFLLWLGVPPHRVNESKAHDFCRILSEFALEYRTTRERVLQQIEKKANHRERNKTRGKMITQVPGKFHSKEDRADAELRQLLGGESDLDTSTGTVTTGGTLTWRRRRQDAVKIQRDESFTDGDDEILESLVKTATQGPARGHQHSSSGGPRERKRTRHADRKSLRRTLKNGLSEEEKKHLAAYIKGY